MSEHQHPICLASLYILCLSDKIGWVFGQIKDVGLPAISLSLARLACSSAQEEVGTDWTARECDRGNEQGGQYSLYSTVGMYQLGIHYSCGSGCKSQYV